VGKRPICQASDSVVGPWDSGWNGFARCPQLYLLRPIAPKPPTVEWFLGALTVRSALLNGIEQRGLPYVIQAQWLQTKSRPGGMDAGAARLVDPTLAK